MEKYVGEQKANISYKLSTPGYTKYTIGCPKKVIHRIANQKESLDNNLANKIADIWGKKLGFADVPRDVTFFELGGDSLDVQMMLWELEENYDLQLDWDTLNNYPTVNSLAEYLQSTLYTKQKDLLLLPETAEKLTRILLFVLGEIIGKKVTPDMAFSTFNMTEDTYAECQKIVEQIFHINIDIAEWKKFLTIGDLNCFLLNNIAPEQLELYINTFSEVSGL